MVMVIRKVIYFPKAIKGIYEAFQHIWSVIINKLDIINLYYTLKQDQ